MWPLVTTLVTSPSWMLEPGRQRYLAWDWTRRGGEASALYAFIATILSVADILSVDTILCPWAVDSKCCLGILFLGF